MDLEEMKNQWAGINARIDRIETNINQQKIDKMKTSQQQLVTQYRVFGGLASIFTLLSYFILSRLDVNVWIELGVVVFFFVCTMMDFFLQRKVGEINLTTMPVIEVAQKASACRHLHHIFQIILIPSAIALLAFLAYDTTGNKAFIYGICIGAAIGAAFGLKGYLKIMANYKSLIKE